jgi:energy-coupling factor transporter ATP-binding protein EcfA2
MKARYTASQRPTKDGTGRVLAFRHPLRKDARGKQGLKMQRGLSTSDEARAQALADQMTELLQDTNWHSIAKRDEAERRFDPIVVRAFYDEIETTAFNSLEVRNEALPLPTAEQGYTQVMLVGTTGAGKTSLLSHLIGFHPKRDRFPATSASRTTISDIEVITSDDPTYRAVVTFFNEWGVHTNVHECVANACAALWDQLPDDKLAERFLTHRDLRFRLGYIIGSWKQPTAATEADADWEYGGEHDAGDLPEESDSALPARRDLERMQATLCSFLDRVRRLAANAKQRLLAELSVDLDGLAGSEREEAQDRFEDIVQSLPDFDDLVNDLMEEIKRRFASIAADKLRTHPNGWPQSWEFETADRADFVRAVRRFSSNDAAAFGSLLTPLVDGLRIQGQFFPAFADRHPRLVLLDGEGLGHVTDSAAGVASRIAKRFGEVNVILLVDSAKAPMLDAPTSVLRAVATSGYQKKLAIAFTHFDLLTGQANLPTYEAQRAHVLSSVHQRLAGLKEVAGQPAVRALERGLDERCFMLGFLNRNLTEKHRGPVREFLKLIDFCESAIEPETLADVCPVYDAAGLVLAIQSATTDFHARWDAILGFTRSANTRTAHFNQVKALNRRVVLDMDNAEYMDLKPVADFVARLSESITKFLDRPIRWKPRVPSEPEADEALSRVQREVFDRLHEFVEEKILRIPRQQWMKAFEYRGDRSTFARARTIKTIYEAATPIPGPALDLHSEQFLREVRLLVHEAIGEGGGQLVSDLLGSPASTAHIRATIP